MPGITVYAYLTRPLVEAFGPGMALSRHGRGEFAKPIFEGDDVLLTAR